MITITIKTENLDLVLLTPEQTRARIDTMTSAEKAQLSVQWLALVETAPQADPWIHGFDMVQRADQAIVGSCGFKGPPAPDSIVEIAYGVHPDYQGQGYATEAAQALVSFALSHSQVRMVRAHTLPESNASTRVLTKCGFRRVGAVIDPEDGLVWRWERGKGAE